MKRKRLTQYAQEIAAELIGRKYDGLVDEEFPITYESALEGEQVQVEIDLLERTQEYLHLVVQASCGWLSELIPSHADIIVRHGKE